MGQNYKRAPKGAAVFDDAKRWDGWGTALKPAHEPVALARKPFPGTVAGNVLVHGAGALNVDACRVGHRGRKKITDPKSTSNAYGSIDSRGGKLLPDERWPANIITDGSTDVLEAFPASAREAIRFFYAPKADKAEREFGMDGANRLTGEQIKGRQAGSAGTLTAHSGLNNSERANIHPTVKPIDLMAWLCRLTTAPAGTILEPFMGSGSTGIAAVRHGFRFVGIEQSPEYFDIALRRIRAAVEAEESAPRFEHQITKAIRAVQQELFAGAL